MSPSEIALLASAIISCSDSQPGEAIAKSKERTMWLRTFLAAAGRMFT
jgi:hypothetical protein